MFKLIGVFFKCIESTINKSALFIETNLDSGIVLARTGNAYAQQFEADAMLELIAKRQAQTPPKSIA